MRWVLSGVGPSTLPAPSTPWNGASLICGAFLDMTPFPWQAGNTLGGTGICLGVVSIQCTAKMLRISVPNGCLVVLNTCVMFALSAHPEPDVKYCSIYHECVSHCANFRGVVPTFYSGSGGLPSRVAV